VYDDRVLAALRGPATELEQVTALLDAIGLDPAATSLGAADRALVALHRELVGRDLQTSVRCVGCGEQSVVALGPDDLPAPSSRTRWFAPGMGLREPTYADLQGLPTDAAEATAELVRRCRAGTATMTSRVAGGSDLAAVDDSLTGPVVLVCPGCGALVEAALDVVPLVLADLVLVADEVDLEIHLLARAYGWDLAVIEALPAARRHRFAELVDLGR